MKISKGGWINTICEIIRGRVHVDDKLDRDMRYFMTDPENTTLYIKYESTVWGGGCTVTVDGTGKVRITWSSTDRTPSMAMEAIECYRKATLLAIEIEAFVQTAEVTK